MSEGTKFTTAVYPALSIDMAGNRYKFAGGELIVGPGEAETIRAWALRNPSYGVIEAGPEEIDEQEPEVAEDEPAAKMSMNKATLMALAEQRGIDGRRMNKTELIDAINA